MDTIFLNNLLFIGNHGVGAPERSKPQRFECDIELRQKPREWGDSIKKTYNYMDAHEIARKEFEEQSFKLIESIGENIALGILKNPKIESVSVTIRKLDILKHGVCGVTITRGR
ncbi:dihydroneopterin aldolase [Patescibacteria group bacterium]|jgi:dihydroneopterin aldolase|nr:dihydroneopterin aldolase [Patescibacteria group bacterium]